MKHMNSDSDGKKRASSPALAAASNVFLVDDDASVRRALARLIKSAGHQVQTFASAQEFLGTQSRRRRSSLPRARRSYAGSYRHRPTAGITNFEPQCADCFHHRPRRHSDERQGDEGRRRGFSAQAGQGHGSVARHRTGARSRLARSCRAAKNWQTSKARVEKLTAREREVMALVASGMPNKRIAFELGTVEKTIKVHRARIMQKMQVQSLADLVRAAEKLRLAAKT